MHKQRNPQPLGERGSLKWIQRLIEHNPSMLADAIRAATDREPSWTVDWVSPRAADEWSEYRDAGFLLRSKLPSLVNDLATFWPTGGPQWDALGCTSTGGVILVEAKAHLPELSSSCGAGESSLKLIRESLAKTKSVMGVSESADWLSGYYQYANRLAHLHFLRDRGVEANLVFVYFCGDTDLNGPADASRWKALLQPVYSQLGVNEDLSTFGVVNVFVPVATL